MRLSLVLLLACVLLACDKLSDHTDKVNESAESTAEVIKPAEPERANHGIWSGAAYEPTYVEMELKQVSPHVYYVEGNAGAPTDFDGFMSNASVVVTDEGVLVFDSLGTPSLAYLLLNKIREITDKAVVKVVVSHYHADHIYGLQVFKQRGAEVIAPLGAKDYLESDSSKSRLEERRESLFPWVNESTYLVQPDVFVAKDTRFTLGGVQFIVRLLGAAHSNGDLMLYVVQDKVLLADAIVPGHGPASTQAVQVLDFTHDYLQYLQTTMQDAVDELIPFDEAYKMTDWSAYEKLPAFRVNRNNAYFMYLALEQASVN